MIYFKKQPFTFETMTEVNAYLLFLYTVKPLFLLTQRGQNVKLHALS